MGANMARRLKDQGFHVTALYDAHRPAATTLAQELGSFASQSLGEVTASADVIITVVSDDAAMREIFTAPDDNLLVKAQGKALHQLRHHFAGGASGGRGPGAQDRRADA